MKRSDFSKHIILSDTTITDSFWKNMQELVRTAVIPYQYDALHDRVENAEKSYCIENFIKAGKIVKALRDKKEVPKYPTDKWCYDDNNAHPDAFHGWVFQDSDVYKWLEAVGYSLICHPDKELEKKAFDIIDIICAAQLDNGYLDTLYIINNPDEIFTNLKDFHELYCFGHLAEAAVSIYNSTGNDKLLNAAYRFADLICNTFGKDKIKGYGGHEIAELALVKLYDLSGEKRYLDMAEFFIDERGKKPYYYDLVLGRKTVDDNYHYNQAHAQPRYQREAVGHAVRGVYLYSGMADVAKRCGDDGLYEACIKIIENIKNEKMYITGGIGANVDGESFSFGYDLPNDLAYSETCASIGLIFFAMRMLEIKPCAEYAQIIETALYNTVLSGMAQDGKSFFYVNPLEVLPIASRLDSRKRHIKPVRQKWFGCACCPPNLARLLSDLGEYVMSENEETLFVHQYIGGVYNTKNAEIELISDYVNSGSVTFDIKPERNFTLALRIPEWCCNHFTVSCDYEKQNGYIYVNITKESSITVKFEIIPRFIKCSNRVRANVGKVAVCRGPFVYCCEEADNGDNLQLLRIDTNTMPKYKDGAVFVNGFRQKADEVLYSEFSTYSEENVQIKLIPYYTWGNRGENEMCVYLRV